MFSEILCYRSKCLINRVRSIAFPFSRVPRSRAQPYADEGYEFENSFKPRHDDIIIATYPKTGNTLLTQLSHQIRRPGDASYEDIYDVCPFLEFLWPLGVDDAENESLRFNSLKPRIFKHHKYLSACYEGGKYVCTFRDPESAITSLYNMCIVSGYTQARNVDEFVKDSNILDNKWGWGANIFQYYVEQWKCRNCSNVLLLCFEDLTSDLRSHVYLLARFMNVSTLTEHDVNKILRCCSRKYMMDHSSKFDESVTYDRMKRLGRWASPFRPSSRVTSGEHHKSQRKQISDELRAKLKACWNRTMRKEFGFENYNALRRAIGELTQ